MPGAPKWPGDWSGMSTCPLPGGVCCDAERFEPCTQILCRPLFSEHPLLGTLRSEELPTHSASPHLLERLLDFMSLTSRA